jgi:hypothetical protein
MPYGVTWEEADHMNLPMGFDRWVNGNNPDERLPCGKGWWDYIELIRRVMSNSMPKGRLRITVLRYYVLAGAATWP